MEIESGRTYHICRRYSLIPPWRMLRIVRARDMAAVGLSWFEVSKSNGWPAWLLTSGRPE
jgi:hypothetical protein